MGMFDEIKCSCYIGALTDVTCQTKDIDPLNGGSMFFYWVDPSGLLWLPDYSGTYNFAMVNKKYKTIPNGNRGKLRRTFLSGDIRVYDSVTHPDVRGVSEVLFLTLC